MKRKNKMKEEEKMINKILKSIKTIQICLLTSLEIGFILSNCGFLFTPFFIVALYFILTEEV